MNFSDIKRFFLLSHLTYRSRYADSVIGVFWIPLSSLFLISVLVLIFSGSESNSLQRYASYISLGYLTWSFISDTLNNHCDVFRTKRNDLGAPNVKIADVFMKALVDRTYLLTIKLVCLCFIYVGGIVWSFERLFIFVLTSMILLLTSFFLSYLFSMATLFFPDFKRLISNFTRVLFFASPIFWGFGGQITGARYYFYTFNPITYYLELMRFSFGAEISISAYLALKVVLVGLLIIVLLSYLTNKASPVFLRNIQ